MTQTADKTSQSKASGKRVRKSSHGSAAPHPEADFNFTADNPQNIRTVMGHHKNVLICGIKGVGKITNAVNAIQENRNVYYIGNQVDYEGKRRPGSYEKYINYILSLKKDMTIVEDIRSLLDIKEKIVLIIDEIFGRTEDELLLISSLYDRENIGILQIVGCIKNMGNLIEKTDIILQLHHDMTFVIEKEFGRIICRVLGSKHS